MGSWPPWNISSHSDCLWQFPTTFPVFLYSAHMLIWKLLGKITGASSQVPNATMVPPDGTSQVHQSQRVQNPDYLLCHRYYCTACFRFTPNFQQSLTSPQLLVPRIPRPDSQWKDEQDLHRTISTLQSLKPLILKFPTEIQQAKNQFLLSKIRDNPLSAWHSAHTCRNGASLEQNHSFINSTFPSGGEDCHLMSEVSYG